MHSQNKKIYKPALRGEAFNFMLSGIGIFEDGFGDVHYADSLSYLLPTTDYTKTTKLIVLSITNKNKQLS